MCVCLSVCVGGEARGWGVGGGLPRLALVNLAWGSPGLHAPVSCRPGARARGPGGCSPALARQPGACPRPGGQAGSAPDAAGRGPLGWPCHPSDLGWLTLGGRATQVTLGGRATQVPSLKTTAGDGSSTLPAAPARGGDPALRPPPRLKSRPPFGRIRVGLRE